MRAIDQPPDSIICSTAARARETVESAAEAGDWKCPIRFEREVYESSPVLALDHVQRETDMTRRLLLAGHEPTCSELIRLLADNGPLPFPPAALACLAFDVENWGRCGPRPGTAALGGHAETAARGRLGTFSRIRMTLAPQLEKHSSPAASSFYKRLQPLGLRVTHLLDQTRVLEQLRAGLQLGRGFKTELNRIDVGTIGIRIALIARPGPLEKLAQNIPIANLFEPAARRGDFAR